ncbi:MAG: HIT family protein [Armatimonadota bacterium]
MAYINSAKEPKSTGECIFCSKPAQDRDPENFILYRSPLVFVILNAYPYNNGHLMVVPYSHCGRLSDLSDEELAELMLVTRLCVEVLDQAVHPDGYNIGVNLGMAAGAGIADHLHIHVVPRWNGDTNFMASIADVKVVPQSLPAAYESLRPFFDAKTCQRKP